MSVPLCLGLMALASWLYLLMGRGLFWLVRERDEVSPPPPACWPSVVAVVPARDEADMIARSVGSLLGQDYPGSFRVILVDDGSSDGTARAARLEAEARGAATRLDILAGAPLPSGWTGKIWAQHQGIAVAAEAKPDYLLLTDADIHHAPDNLRALVARAEQGGLAMTSLMALLCCGNRAERFLIPAFVFFFQMLYPFAWVADRSARTAAAAGGCMLVRRNALEAAGGIAAIRGEIIDDCALGRALKRQGPVWLGLTRRARSLRPYNSVADIGRMIARSAYAQLGYSPLLLAGTLLGMGLAYLAPPLLALLVEGWAAWLGAAAWAAMAVAFQPMLRFYRVSPLWGLALPAIGAAYGLFTLQSAWQVWRGRGGMWKGRFQAMAGRA
ncbi:glycosyltransferase [Pseudoroseomonas globiformis]|uniref:Glycosyltransferase n=1 Tax=Teichococcus globiformis TaxID=2307229 RepID=A0ABV7G085_9PROT